MPYNQGLENIRYPAHAEFYLDILDLSQIIIMLRLVIY
jgi:hypothetical protein